MNKYPHVKVNNEITILGREAGVYLLSMHLGISAYKYVCMDMCMRYIAIK